MDDLLREFLIETNESLDLVDAQLVRFEQEPNNAQIPDNIFRLVHTIKGTCGFLALPRLEALAHAAEALMSKFRSGMPVSSEAVTLILATLDRIKDLLDELEQHQREQDGSDRDLIGTLERMSGAESPVAIADAPPIGPGDAGSERDSEQAPEGRVARQTIRVNVNTLEHLMTMVSELVLTRNQLLELMRRHEDSEFKAPLQRLSSVTAELQEGVMRTRMQPIHSAWQKLPRIVRDLATELGKDIELEMYGSETELDRQVLELIKDPLTHMVRNSADHGIETPQERRAAGKPEQGTIRLTAYHEGGYIIIGITDDGRGLDTERIKATALARGLATEAEIEKMSEAHVHRFIFAPGFSTATKVTSVSGRGVGMDVVRTNIEQIGGTVDVTSIKGEGLSFTVKIPLTLAIISALIVEAAGERFAIPQRSVVELVHARVGSDHRIEHIKDAPVLRLRNKLLPLVQLGKLLNLASGDADLENAFIAVIQVGEPFGIVVDGVVHTEEIVVKPLSTRLRHVTLFSGTTILGDGSVILILDPNGMARAIGTAAASYEVAEKPTHEASRMDDMTSLLVFRAGSPEPKAVPLSLVTRLEEVDGRKIELSNGRHMVQYRGQLMPLVPINGEVRIKGEGAQPLVVFSDSGRSMGLVVDEIVDIVEDKLDIAVASERPGVLGSALIKGRATEIIDVGHFLPIAYEDWFRRKEMGSAAQRSVLLVDDSPFFRNLLAPVLRAAGFEVVTVGAGPEALAMLRSGRRFDVLLTDLDMPGMSGFELAAAVHRDAQTADLPIIALSSTTEQEIDERGRHAGFRDHISKSDRQRLIAALKAQSQVSRAA